MYQVPASRSSVVQFVMTCPGMSHSSTFTLHMRDSGEGDDGKVWGDLCREKRVNIAYNNDPFFKVDSDTGKMVRYPVYPSLDSYIYMYSYIPRNWEILDRDVFKKKENFTKGCAAPRPQQTTFFPLFLKTSHSFFKNHDIVPIWMNCHYTWGVYDEESGKWTGAVGKVTWDLNKYIKM